MADANPLNKSLPAEVVSRRRPQQKRVVETRPADEVEIDLRAALALRPEKRLNWLAKACEMAKDGKASSTELFDIISNRKFSSGLPDKVGRKMCSIAHEYEAMFSDRQQRYMHSDEWILNTKYGADENEERDDEDGKANNDTGSPPRRDYRDSGSARPRDDARTREDDRTRPRDDARTRENGRMREDDRYDDAVESPYAQKVPREVDDIARREALERRLAAEERERKQKREERKRQAAGEGEDFAARLLNPPPKKQKREDEVDEVDNMLERLMGGGGQQAQQQPEEPPTRRRHRRGHTSRSRSMELQPTHRRARRGNGRNGMSRSRSISVQAAPLSESPSPRRNRPNRGGGGGGGNPTISFEEALRKRMEQRDSEIDSSRIPVTWTREDMRSGRHLQNRSKYGGRSVR